MNPINHFELNRPVHLARRDVYFEKAVELIAGSQPLHGDALGGEVSELILHMLRIARHHAEFAVRSDGLTGHDEEFCRFINLLVSNIKAVLSMIDLKGMIEDTEESSFNFLGANRASAGLQAEEYQRRANDIVRSIQNTLKLAREPFENLKAENREVATDEENVRYKRARKHFLKLVGKDLSVGKVPSIFRRIMRAKNISYG